MIDQLDYYMLETTIQSNVRFIRDARKEVQEIRVGLLKNYFLMSNFMIMQLILIPQYSWIFTTTLEACFPLLVFPKPILLDYSPLLQVFSTKFLIVENDDKVIPKYVESGTMENKFTLFVICVSYQYIQMD